MTEQELAEIRAYCDKATAGPWTAGRSDMATLVDGAPSKWVYAGDAYCAVASGADIEDWAEVMANAELIARSRTDLPRCLDEIASLRSEIEQLKTELAMANDAANKGEDGRKLGVAFEEARTEANQKQQLLTEAEIVILDLRKEIERLGRERDERQPQLVQVTSEMDGEQARWQQAIYELCCKRTERLNPCPSIDGKGCESGDPLDFTLSEIGQALAAWEDQADQLRAENATLRAAIGRAAQELEDALVDCIKYPQLAVHKQTEDRLHKVGATLKAALSASTESEL